MEKKGMDNPAYDRDRYDEKPAITKIRSAEHQPARQTVSSPMTLSVPQLTVTGSNGSEGEVPVVLEEDLVKVTDFDDVLPHVGEFGAYQIGLFFLTAPFCFFLAFSYFSQVFITLVPEHWCLVPDLVGNNQSSGFSPQQMYVSLIPLLLLGIIYLYITYTVYSLYYILSF